ncbi:MAG: Lrp/AsnC family transcriptional regulator [Erysipelotrichaceae bacterium]|nr:Lrp/AsnC family transcriptional regulator [Erysipelotrichaceae bacterium]
MTDKVTDKELAILNLVMNSPRLSYTEIAATLNLSRKTVSVRIRNLKNKGIIERIGSDRKGYWKVNF